MRITRSRPELPAVQRGKEIKFTLDGVIVRAFEGETIAAVLFAEGKRRFRSTPLKGEPRGLFCGMGVCFECLVTVNGVPGVRACLTPVQDGMQVETDAALVFSPAEASHD